MTRRKKFFLAVNGLLLAAWGASFVFGGRALGDLALAAVLVLLFLWGVQAFFRRFLWRVGRKLAFSYFLIGVLPIPMVLLLLGVGVYVLSGALVGHLFRDHFQDFHESIVHTAEGTLDQHVKGLKGPGRMDDLTFAYYRDGIRTAGDPTAPVDWPAFLVSSDESSDEPARFLADSSGEASYAVAVERGNAGVVALYRGDLAQALSERSGIWMEIEPFDQTVAEKDRIQVQLGEQQIVLSSSARELASEDRAAFFGGETVEGQLSYANLPWFDRPVLFWGELLGTVISPANPDRPLRLGALLNTSPRSLNRQVVSSAAEVDTAAWGLLVGLAFLLFDIYAVAALMALFMIYGLSRAVNRLSKATTAVGEGDFSVRIPVRRRDQLGELQRSYNQMAASLEELVSTAAQKESLEKELAVARELQQNLLPSSLTTTEAMEFASYFEPSAAIGGDYFDLLKLDDGRIMVVVADVSGHGLSAGLRMAMLKAALQMLVEQQLPPAQIFERLDSMIRSEEAPGPGRPMVTATLALFDPKTGRLELTNAGHTPTYRLHHGEPIEITLPSPPLGLLKNNYGTASIELEPGDLVVWLSDGLIEATDSQDEAFGYDRIKDALRGRPANASQLRDWILAAVSAHTGGIPPDDDRTLVVLRYLPAMTI